MPPTDSRALELTANIQVAGSTLYALNDRHIPSNLWSAQVQPGFDGNDRRLSVAECEVIAEKIAAALSATSPEAAPAAMEVTGPAMQLNATQLRSALEFVAPDFDADEDQREAEVVLQRLPARTSTVGEPMEAGLYCWLAEYPEEGCIPLREDEAFPAATPAAPSAGVLAWLEEHHDGRMRLFFDGDGAYDQDAGWGHKRTEVLGPVALARYATLIERNRAALARPAPVQPASANVGGGSLIENMEYPNGIPVSQVPKIAAPVQAGAQQAVAEAVVAESHRRFGPLVRAAINLIAAVQEHHDQHPSPRKYAVPYGAVNDLRAALAAPTQAGAGDAKGGA